MTELVLDVFREFLLGRTKITVPEHLIDLDADPLISKGWSVPEGWHQKGGQLRWDSAKVKLFPL